MINSACGEGCPVVVVHAAQFLWKLRGSSQPSVLMGSNGGFYVVKFHGFPGHRGLANEVVGSELIRIAGLPAPAWTPIEISREFIDSNPQMWFLTAGGNAIKPLPGLHFASKLIEADGEQRTYQMIPHAWVNRIENRADFLGVLAIDLWANNCDRRQAVFLCDSCNRLHASFIDNDFMFGGKFGSDITCPRRAMAHDLDLYRGLWSRASVRHWLSVIDGIQNETIWEFVSSVPDIWASEQTRLDIFDQLVKRRPLLPRLLESAQDAVRSSYSIHYHRTINATQPSLCAA